MSRYFSNDIERLKFLRKFVKGYDAKDGWVIKGGRIYAPDLPTKQYARQFDKFHSRVGAILAATSTPYKVVHNQSEEKRNILNSISGVNVKPELMKVGILRAETEQSKIKKVYQEGYAVQEGVFSKYYIKYDILKLFKYGEEYIRELTDSIIPKHLGKRYKMLSSFGNVEFNGTFRSAEKLAQELIMLSNKYMQDVQQGRFMKAFVVYAFNEEFVDVKELGMHINNFLEVRTRRGGKRRKQKKFKIDIFDEDEEGFDNE